MSKPLRAQIEDAIQRASDAIHDSTDWWDGYDRDKPIIEELLDTIMEAVGRDAGTCIKHRTTLEHIASELGFTADEIAQYQPSQMLVGGIASRAAFLLQCAARWEHAKTEFLFASEVDAIEARIDAGIAAQKETT